MTKAYVMYELLDTGWRGYIRKPYARNAARKIIRIAGARSDGWARYWLIEESSLPTTEDIHRLVAGGS